jgi:translation initiation factor 2B subunit (eIF-2B alpha/beta/delta family)
MSPDLEKRIARLAADRESGASEILDEAIAILRDALNTRDDIVTVAQALCAAQPTMGSIWNAALTASASRDQPERFEWFAHRVARAPDALARFARDVFQGTGEKEGSLRLATISYSRTVLHTLESLAAGRPLQVACAEGRPALEGRTMAARLASRGVDVTIFTDGAIGHALDSVHGVVVGADAIGADFVLNKSGTRMLAAAATHHGVPFYVLASRDKFVNRATAVQLRPREGPAAEVWPEPPPRVAIRNPYFEATPLDLVTLVITDFGAVGAASVPDVCLAIKPDQS